jgi:hypothetical protein
VDSAYAVVRMIARFWIWFFFERVEVRQLTRAQEARGLLAERRELVDELERTRRDYLEEPRV